MQSPSTPRWQLLRPSPPADALGFPRSALQSYVSTCRHGLPERLARPAARSGGRCSSASPALSHDCPPGLLARIRRMTAKELVLQEAPTWSEEQAARALRAAHIEPGDVIDDWGNLSAMARASTSRAMRRMAEEEAAAGFSWDDHLPS